MNEERLEKLEGFIDEFLAQKQEQYGENFAICEKLEHIDRTTKLTEILCPDDRLAHITAKYHDIGRFPQFELLGAFNDGKVLHHYLGEDLITRALFRGNLEQSEELDIIRQAVSYHGRMKYMPYKTDIPERVNEIVDVISRVDDIDNGCIGAVGYLEREAYEDVKGYKEADPDADQTKVSEDVWEFFKKGEKFDKMKYCKTYADYTLFASVLAIVALKDKDRVLAVKALELPCKGSKIGDEERRTYDTALDGYKDIFSRLVDKEKCDIAYEILEGFYKDKDYEYNEVEAPSEGEPRKQEDYFI